jgi:hypothetical protein
MDAVVIGMDPHKRSATIEVMDADETVLDGGRFFTDAAGYQAMLTFAKRFPQRTWAIEGCAGIGKHIAHRLICWPRCVRVMRPARPDVVSLRN